LRKLQIGVIGAASCSPGELNLAEDVGREIARRGAVLVCGGLGGVMKAAAHGAKEAGGLTVGIIPGDNPNLANPYIDIVITTDLGHARNVLVVHSSQAVIAVSGSHGTLSEIAVALKLGKPVISLRSWKVDPQIIEAEDPVWAVQRACELALYPPPTDIPFIKTER